MEQLTAKEFITLLRKKGDLTYLGEYCVIGEVKLTGYFRKKIIHGKAIFEGNYSCVNTTFRKGYSCEGVIFKENYTCKRVTFRGNCNYTRATFLGDYSCERVTFKKTCEYRETTFETSYNAERTNFETVCSYERTIFKGLYKFTNSEVKNGIYIETFFRGNSFLFDGTYFEKIYSSKEISKFFHYAFPETPVICNEFLKTK